MSINELWEAEFRGLFWGEGSIGFTYYYSQRGTFLFRPNLKINLRGDDRDILEDIKQHLGGHIYFTKKSRLTHHANGDFWSKPSVEWTVTNQDEVRNIHRILLAGLLPAKKRRDVLAFGTILDLLHTTGKKYSIEEKERIRTLIDALRADRVYQPQQDDQIVSV